MFFFFPFFPPYFECRSGQISFASATRNPAEGTGPLERAGPEFEPLDEAGPPEAEDALPDPDRQIFVKSSCTSLASVLTGISVKDMYNAEIYNVPGSQAELKKSIF